MGPGFRRGDTEGEGKPNTSRTTNLQYVIAGLACPGAGGDQPG